MAVNCVGEAETTARISMHQIPPSFGKRLEKSEEVNEGEPLELKAKISGSPKPKVILVATDEFEIFMFSWL